MQPLSRPNDRGPLIVRLCNWVGEVVLAVPTLQRLTAAGFELHLVGKSWARDLLLGEGWSVVARPHGSWQAANQLRRLQQSLKRDHPLAKTVPMLLLTKSFSSALEARLASVTSYGYAHDGRSILLNHHYKLTTFAHASHSYWHLASCLLNEATPAPEHVTLQLHTKDFAEAGRLLTTHQLAPKRYVVLCPFTGADDTEGKKVWPGFRALGELLHASGIACVVCPGPGEESRVAARLPHAIQFSGTSLGVYGAILKNADAVIANDTGPGHLAAAVGARLIAIYGQRSTKYWAPLGTHTRLLHENSGWPTATAVHSLL